MKISPDMIPDDAMRLSCIAIAKCIANFAESEVLIQASNIDIRIMAALDPSTLSNSSFQMDWEFFKEKLRSFQTNPVKRRRFSSGTLMDSLKLMGDSNEDVALSAEVENFKKLRIPSVSNVLEWWKENESEYPNIALMAKSYLSVPSTSVPSERLFSRAGWLMNKRRCSMKISTYEKYVWLSRNMDIIDQLYGDEQNFTEMEDETGQASSLNSSVFSEDGALLPI